MALFAAVATLPQNAIPQTSAALSVRKKSMIRKFIKWLKRKESVVGGVIFPQSTIVESNDIYISVIHPDRLPEKVLWKNVTKIEILTKFPDPWGADYWFKISSKNEECSFPQGAVGEKDAINYIISIKGFNHKIFAKAMASKEDSSFVCWESQENF